MTKRLFALLSALAFVLCLSACRKKAEPIVLPPAEEVISISVVDGDRAATSTDTEWIGETMSILTDMESTAKASVNDAPSVENYVSINFNCSDDTVKSVYFYEDKGKQYVEQAYQGIYIPAPALGTKIADLLNKQASTDTVEPKPKVDADISLAPVETDRKEVATHEPQLNDMRPMVMLGGKMYYDTGKISTIDGRCGVMDGEITSTVDATQAPTEDNQSNFGSGYEYQFVAENTVEIIINERWCVFEYGSDD